MTNPNIRTCSLGSCDRKHFSKGLCQPHYTRLRNTGDVREHEPIVTYTKHWATRHPLYTSWQRWRHRCHNPNDPQYDRWGAQGIVMYEGWRTNARAFIDWVETHLPPRPDDEFFLGRIDLDGNVVPGNIQWVDRPQPR